MIFDPGASWAGVAAASLFGCTAARGDVVDSATRGCGDARRYEGNLRAFIELPKTLIREAARWVSLNLLTTTWGDSSTL
jgi:hypothetical protein